MLEHAVSTVHPIMDKTAATVAKCITEWWIQYFGPRTPWENGRTERRGDICKKKIERARWMQLSERPRCTPTLGSGVQCCQKTIVQSSSYSPLQRVFGIGHRLPADLTSDDIYALDPIFDLAATDTSFEELR